MSELKYRGGVAYTWGESTQTEAEFTSSLNEYVSNYIKQFGTEPDYVDGNNKPEKAIIDEALAAYKSLQAEQAPVEFTIPSAILRPSREEFVNEVYTLVTEGQTIGTVAVSPINEGELVKVSIIKKAYNALTDERKSEIAELAKKFAQ